MIEKGKISALQLAMMMYPTILATAVLTVPGITAYYARNDMWMSPIWASLIGFLTVYIAYKLHQLYPKQTLIQLLELIIGRIPGKILGLTFVLFYLQITGNIVRTFSDFMIGVFYENTPISVVMGSMMLVCAFTVRGGLEVVGRSAQFFFPIFILSFLFINLLLIPEMKSENLFPILADGWGPSLKGAILPQSWFTEFLLISFFLPYLMDTKKGLKWSLISVSAVMLTMVVTNLVILFLFSYEASNMLYPVVTAAKYISIADFFENLESIVMAMWILGSFVKISVFFYATVLGAAQWASLSDYRPIVFPIGFLVVLFGFWSMPNFIELNQSDVQYFVFAGPLMQTILPLLLLLLAMLRKRKERKCLD